MPVLTRTPDISIAKSNPPMKTTLLSIFLCILTNLALAQSDSTLKPIQYREAVEGYGRNIHGTRIYSYGGIDVLNPTQTLRPYILAIKDSSATYEYQLYEKQMEKLSEKSAIFWTLFITGTIEITVGAIQKKNYNTALAQQRQNYYSTPPPVTTTTTPSTPTVPICECQCWTGIGDASGTIVYTCGSNTSIKTTNPWPSPLITPSTPTTQPVSSSGPPTSVDLPNGNSWIIAGLSSYFLGTVFALSGISKLNPGFHFLRSVQYYNRALGKKVSWQLQPMGGFNFSGVRLVGKF